MIKPRLRLLVLAMGLLIALSGGPVPAAAAQSTFSIVPAQQTVSLAAGSVQVDVRIAGAQDMAAFQFLLRYDAGVLSAPVVTQGDFLGSGGRNVQCPDPIVDAATSGAGTLKYGCGTLGQGQGVNGDGLLATVRFKLAGGSTTAIAIESLSVANALGDSRCGDGCVAVGGAVDVRGADPGQNQGLAPIPTPRVVATPSDASSPQTLVTPVAAGGQGIPEATSGSGASGEPTGVPGLSGPSRGSSGFTGVVGAQTGPGLRGRGVANLGTGAGAGGGPDRRLVDVSLALLIVGILVCSMALTGLWKRQKSR